MSQEHKTWTYRVRQLPLAFGEAEVITTLQQHLQEDTSSPKVRVYSLARDVASLHTSRMKTATVTIDPQPSSLREQTKWSFSTYYKGSEYTIIVDREFLDFTVLNEVSDEEHTLEYVTGSKKKKKKLLVVILMEIAVLQSVGSAVIPLGPGNTEVEAHSCGLGIVFLMIFRASGQLSMAMIPRFQKATHSKALTISRPDL